ncbi:MAG: GNAT family N-acetyltransferase [Anaerolineae bacterium]|nr:GNAT family N-acetyltransferase [Anaerolineae bacterium]
MAVKIIPYHYRSPLLQEAVRVYIDVWQRNKEESLVFFRNYAQLPYFYGFVAQQNKKIVGTAFGVQSKTGQWWHDKVAAQVGANHPTLQESWVLTELAVLDAYRNQQIGALLHDHVLNVQPFPNVLLSTQVSNIGAQRFYQQHGWQIIHAGFAFTRGHEPYVIMHKSVTHSC